VSFVTYGALTVLVSGVPLGRGYELCYINGEDGWSLVKLSAGGSGAGTGIVDDVVVIGLTDDHIVGRGRDGWFRLSLGSEQADALVEQEAQRLLADSGARAQMTTPSNLRSRLILSSFWWIFALEGVVFLPVVVRLAKRRAKTHEGNTGGQS
jgi:hypothetical protein